MPARLDSAAAARSVISRAEQFVARWPGGYGRTLWQRVAIIQDDPADLAIGLWFACAGAQVQVCCEDDSPWMRDRDDELMPQLAKIIASREPRLLTQPLEGIQYNNYRGRWGFAYLHGSDEELDEQLTGPIEVVLIDGLSRLSRDPAALLRLIHKKAQWSSSIEILPRPDDANVAETLDDVRRQAIALGFGERTISDEQSPGLSLVRLSTPMSDHPVLEDATIMAHCSARLDVAASLAKGKTILDAGGWAGLGAQRYLAAGAERVVNLDISAEAIELGQSRLGQEERVEFVQWDLNETPLPFESETFDLVICLEALEHIHAQRQAVNDFFRLLKPGGIMLVSVPDHDFESTWERLNQHGNAFHLHVPIRNEFESWLGSFESIRWLRQTDVSGSLVFEEQSRRTPKGGKFAIGEQWDVKTARPQVIMALCTKPASDGHSKRKRSPAIVSDLHLYTSQSDQITQIRADEAAFQISVRKERFDWWTRANVLEARLRDLTAEMETVRKETERQREQIQIEAMQARFDKTQQAIEAITAELAAARAQRESESKRWVEEVHYQARVLNEAQRQRTQINQELNESRRLAAQQAAEIARLTTELRVQTEQAAEERQRRERTHEELVQSMSHLSASLDKDRRSLLHRIEVMLEQSMAQVDRRCLTIEGQVYDLQDELDRPAVSPHRNGSPIT